MEGGITEAFACLHPSMPPVSPPSFASRRHAPSGPGKKVLNLPDLLFWLTFSYLNIADK
jgi:hypothetical protein